MNITDYTATVYVEILVTADEYEEVRFDIGLECTVPYDPGFFDPRWGGEPPSGPEFDITFISYFDPYGRVKDLTWDGLSELVGPEKAEKLFEDAYMQAAETGEF